MLIFASLMGMSWLLISWVRSMANISRFSQGNIGLA